MKTKVLTSTFLAVALFGFGIRAIAQRSSTEDQSQQDQTTQRPGMMGGGMMGQGQGMMDGGMAGMSGQMAAHHQQMSTLMNKLMESMAAIQKEKNSKELKSKLAEHQKLLDQMHSQMTQQMNMMQMMSGQGNQTCPMVDQTPKTPTE